VSDGTERSEEPKKPFSSSDPHRGKCTRCGEVRRVWPLEQPADIVLELEWGYAWLCLPCWREMRYFIGGESA